MSILGGRFGVWLCEVKRSAHCNPEMYFVSTWKDEYVLDVQHKKIHIIFENSYGLYKNATHFKKIKIILRFGRWRRKVESDEDGKILVL